jgi:hypothetical protein
MNTFPETETEHKPCAVCAVDTDYMICANECGAFHCARHSTESHLCRPCEAEEDEEAALQARVLTQKVNPNADQGPAMKVLMRTQEDGRVEVVMPMGVPPDTRGYNLNRAFQKERVSKVVARLQKKLAAKQTK